MAKGQRVETVIVGGGQAGLVAGYHLGRRGREFLILEGNERIGDSWRNRWDSLRLFTPAWVSKLDGWRFPAKSVSFPTKDEMGDYLEAYAEQFGLPFRTGVRVESVTKNGRGFVVTTADGRYEADNVILATGAERLPKVPAFASELDKGIRQMHSADYKGPHQLTDGPVLIVGLGNSGAEIGREVVRTHETYVSGKPSAELPFKHGPNMARFVVPIIRFVGLHVLSMRTPIGRKVRPKFVKLAAPLIRVKTKDLVAAGAELVGRTVGVENGMPVLADGRVLDVKNVIWCTGFRGDYSWVDAPAFDEDGSPRHRRGVASEVPGLYFMGLRFQFAAASDVFPGVGRDADYVAKHIAARVKTGSRDQVVSSSGR